MKKQLVRWSIFVLLAAFTLKFASLVRCAKETSDWNPRDRSIFQVAECEFAKSGVVLTVDARAPVGEVWRQLSTFQPWRSQHRKVTFSTTLLHEGQQQVLVPYEFKPDREWLLAIRTDDGYWISMSPYFPSEPTLTEEEWADRWSRSRRHEAN